MTRRTVLAATGIAACALALPTISAQAAAHQTAEMLFTTDEPWGMLVRGHVSQEQFEKAAIALIDHDSDIRENSEDWLYERNFDDHDEETKPTIAEAGHSYMRIDRENDPFLGTVYVQCNAYDPGAFPITVVMY